MSKPIWPFFDLLVEGYSAQKADNRSATPFETGAVSIKVRSSAKVRPIKASVLFTLPEFATFERWGEETLKEWTLPFLIRDQHYDGSPVLGDGYVPLTDAGVPLIWRDWWLVYFGEGIFTEEERSFDTVRLSLNLSHRIR